MEGSALASQLRPTSPSFIARSATRDSPGRQVHHLADDVACLRLSLVNVVLYGRPGAGDREWVLIDTGMPGSGRAIEELARQRFAPGARPSSIVLTHGHFDHVGSLKRLAEQWDAPVFAHPLELPFLTGRADYPPPDPTVGGGAMATLFSRLFPRRGIDLDGRVSALPVDGSVPGMPGWRFLHTPGHTPGHVSLFRDSDRLLIAGDAFVTQKQESLLGVITAAPMVWRPPAYFTIDWEASRRSVETLAALEPETVATGHGVPLRGEDLRRGLSALAQHFDEVMPQDGRYVRRPARADQQGIVEVPPPVLDPVPLVLAGLGVVALLAVMRRRAVRNQMAQDYGW
ncbi:MAG TPA: MBL fold metallo-hydrolase [Thermoanaerobaculia bacterium]|nr:MBL fold metallo-hydrolase [Thermoanaerobaculia bacterium]